MHVLQPPAILMLNNTAWSQATLALGFRIFLANIDEPAEEKEETQQLVECPKPGQHGLEVLSGSSGKVGHLKFLMKPFNFLNIYNIDIL